MAKLRVRIDREQCIGDMVCVSICPEVFEAAEDGKSAIKRKYRVREDDPSEGIVSEELRDCVMAASEVCPLAIIHVEEEE